MSGFGAPTTDGMFLLGAAVVVPAAVVVALSRARPGTWMRALAWGLLVAAVTIAAWRTLGERAGNRMLLVCTALFFSMKVVVVAEARLAGRAVPSWPSLLAFHFLWVGMRPWAFVTRRRGRRGEGIALIRLGLLFVVAGCALVIGARSMTARAPLVALVLMLVALGCLAHFGALRVLAGAWRAIGFPVRPVCDAPQRSHSLAEFWSRRWNLPFSAMMQIAVQRPLRGVAGGAGATMAVFILSGLLHEVALSLPARGGYGLPLAYFVLHGGLTLAEERLGVGAWSVPARRAWTSAWVVLPVPLLFHPPFLDACIRPLLQ